MPDVSWPAIGGLVRAAAVAAVGFLPTAAPAAPSAAGLAGKLQPYIGCLNDVSPQVADGHGWYVRWADPEKGPSGREVRGPALPRFWGVAECKAALHAARTRPPRLTALETAGEAYARALARVEPLVNEARDYYEQGDYKDDAFAKGKAMHPGLLAAWGEFDQAHRALHGEVVRLNDAREEAELARLEKAAGSRLAYLTRKVLFDAKLLVRSGSLDDPGGLVLEEFRPRLDAYQSSVDELKAYATVHVEGAAGVSRLGLVVDAASQTLAGAKELMRRQRDGRKYDDGEKVLIQANHAELVSGHPAQVMARYNDLVGRANDLPWH